MCRNYLDEFSRIFARDSSLPEMRYLGFLVSEFVRTRNDRVTNIDSPNMKEATNIMNGLFPLPVESFLPCLCIDGRVLSETVFGLPNMASRTPAADIPDALLLHTGELYLAEGDFTDRIRHLVRRFGKAVILLDSHTHCAAKAKEKESALGIPVPDGGLLDDVRRKKLIADALLSFAEREYGAEGRRKVLVIQTAFDVHSGFLFMGLEQESIARNSTVPSGGFTEAVVERLSREQSILSTRLLAEEGGILYRESLGLRDSIGRIDLEGDYSGSLLRLWKGVSMVSKESVREVRRVVDRLFSGSGEGTEMNEIRTCLAVANALLSSVLNGQESYPYRDHRETVVVVTNRARGPYGTASPFPVNEYANGGMAMLSFVVGFAASIVRGNRLKRQFPEGERASIESYFGSDSDTFVKSPVPVFLSERVDEEVSETLIRSLSAIPWKEISWADVSRDEFAVFLRKSVPGISYEAVRGVERLRARALEMYRPGFSATGNLLSGQLALISALRTKSGKVVAVFPFVFSGYSRQYLSSTGKM